MAVIVPANLLRRHLDTSQRAMIAGRLATLERGQTNRWTKSSIKSVSEAATLVRVGPETAKHARIALNLGDDLRCRTRQHNPGMLNRPFANIHGLWVMSQFESSRLMCNDRRCVCD